MDEDTITKEILKKRTKQLAHSKHGVQEAEEEGLKLIVFSLGDESYGLEAQTLKSIRSLKDYIPIPGVASFIKGITNLSGVLFTVIDLKKFLGLPEEEPSENPKMLIADHETLKICFLVDRIIDFKAINPDSLDQHITGIKSLEAGLIKGITSEALIVLNFDKIVEKIKKESK